MKEIRADGKRIIDIFYDNTFVIPAFQRPYSWDEGKCEQLLTDLITAFEENDSEHYFLGNIIYYADESSEKTWEIVDGQQRLITLLLLLHALYQSTRSRKYDILGKLTHQFDQMLGKFVEGHPIRLITHVPSKNNGYGAGDLQNLLGGTFDETKKENRKNPFLLNYKRLEADLDDWWHGNEDKWDGFINYLLEKVVLLPIKCDSRDDALRLFEVINDRGEPLDDADVFKARFYDAVDGEDEKDDFIGRWNNLGKHLDLFRIYMHISKARKANELQDQAQVENLRKREKLRDYISREFLDNKKELETAWESIMDSLAMCDFFKSSIGSWDKKDELFSAQEKIYWQILRGHPTESWQYPLFVFIHKYGDFGEGVLRLGEPEKESYLKLLEASARFFYLRGITRNSIDAVRGEAHDIGVEIERDNLSLNIYNKHHDKQIDIIEADRRLKEFNYSGRYRKGLAFLSSFLNPNQRKDRESITAYATAISGKIHIEHILPRAWRVKSHYEGWTKEEHSENLEKLGNLMPLEFKTNVKASDHFFRAKQEFYRDSKIQDALQLANRKSYTQWLPEDLEKRHQELTKRLVKFFKSNTL